MSQSQALTAMAQNEDSADRRCAVGVLILNNDEAVEHESVM
jgi:hypothetical protein